MKITFFKDSEKLTGELKYYYNGYFTITVEENGGYGVCYVSQGQLEKPINDLVSLFTVETEDKLDLYSSTKFELAEAFAHGYNTCLETKTSSQVAKIYFEEDK